MGEDPRIQDEVQLEGQLERNLLAMSESLTLTRDTDVGAAEVPDDLYRRLRGMAHQLMRGEAVGHTLQTTALVHEAYLRLPDVQSALKESPARFLSIAGDAMRHALIDHARARMRVKRGGDRGRALIELADVPSLLSAEPEQIVALEDSLEALAAIDGLAAQVVHLRFHLGLGVAGTASALEVSERTVKRKWAFARAWLFRELSAEADTRESE